MGRCTVWELQACTEVYSRAKRSLATAPTQILQPQPLLRDPLPQRRQPIEVKAGAHGLARVVVPIPGRRTGARFLAAVEQGDDAAAHRVVDLEPYVGRDRQREAKGRRRARAGAEGGVRGAGKGEAARARR